MDMFFFNLKNTSRDSDTLIQEFRDSAGDFDSFYQGMNSEEKLLFKGYLQKLREEAHSPLATARKVETTLSPLF